MKRHVEAIKDDVFVRSLRWTVTVNWRQCAKCKDKCRIEWKDIQPLPAALEGTFSNGSYRRTTHTLSAIATEAHIQLQRLKQGQKRLLWSVGPWAFSAEGLENVSHTPMWFCLRIQITPQITVYSRVFDKGPLTQLTNININTIHAYGTCSNLSNSPGWGTSR